MQERCAPDFEIVPATLDETLAVARLVPELIPAQVTREEFTRRMSDRVPHLLIAKRKGQPLGFKAGYPISPETFYSWLGGVIPSERRGGVARALLAAQESWVRTAGFQKIEVKSMNRYPAMIQFLIRHGYQITGVEWEERGPGELKIRFSKVLADAELIPPIAGP